MQFVGAWNYETMEFIVRSSIWQGYIEDKFVSKANELPFVKKDKNTSKDSKKMIMRNLDYQNTQNYFNLGCDFIVTSKTFKDIEIPRDLDTKNLFRLIMKIR